MQTAVLGSLVAVGILGGLAEVATASPAATASVGETASPAATASVGDTAWGSGTSGDPYTIPRFEQMIDIDGHLDEPLWANALVLELDYEVRPGENIPPPVRTEVLLTHNRTHLCAAFRAYDSNPNEIRAHVTDRDEIGDDDWVGIILDTFNDEQRCYDLLVNPLGVQQDAIESESGGSSWDAIWDSAGRITDWGYIVELAVPFNQLRFQRASGPQVWGFDAVRRYPRSQSHHIGMFPRDRSNSCYLCQAIKISGFDGASPGRNIEIIPTVTGVATEERRSFPSGGFRREHEDTEFGITGRWGVTPNLTLSGTGNPDFSQVEADAFQLDVNQPFALRFSERRPFFLEGSDFFQTLKAAIYTRTMRDPEWGLKLTGKEGRHTIGAYVVRDERTNLIFPGSQSSGSISLSQDNTVSVLRYKYDLGGASTVGALFTNREGDRYHNRVVGIDTDFRFTPRDQVRVQFLGSQTGYPGAVADSFAQPRNDFTDRYIAFEYDHETRTVGWWLDYDDVGGDFRADVGFVPMVGFRNVEGGWNYSWNAPAEA
jgi:hypothetical protein